jgi:hypothetical protein
MAHLDQCLPNSPKLQANSWKTYLVMAYDPIEVVNDFNDSIDLECEFRKFRE